MRNGINFILICCCAMTAFAREEYRRDFRKTIPLTGGRSFRVENSLGNVTVRTHNKSEAEVQATIRCSAPTANEARSICDQIQILADAASVRTQYPSHFNGRNISYGVDYEILVPETGPLEVRNRFGSVTITDLHAPGTIFNNNGPVYFSGGRGRLQIENSFGSVEVRTNDGELSVRNGNGAVTATDISGTVDVTNRFGNVRITNAGRGVTVHSNNGQIEVTNVSGVATITNTFGGVTVSDAKSDVNVQNSNGEVRVEGVTGMADLHTTFNRVSASRIGKGLTVRAQNATITGDTVGESATVETTFGGVDLRGVKGGARVTAGNSSIRLNGVGGEVYAKTTFNGVTVSDAGGPVTVENQNGSVTVDTKPAQKCQPVSLHTSFGPIRVTIPGGAGYNVTARTSFGRIHSTADMTMSGDIGGDQLMGRIGAGGCDLRLMNQNGNIDIVR